MYENYKYPRTIKFRLGLSSIQAHAELFEDRWPHVIKAVLQHNAWHRWVARALTWLPGPLQRLAQRIWPRYALPACVVLKKLRKPEHIEAFENEKVMYRRLATAQGDLIPRYYGEGVCEGARTLVIDCLPWPTLMKQPLPRMSAEEFERRMAVAMDAMMAHGKNVVHDDPKLGNILLADDGRIVFIDLESLFEAEPGEEALRRKFAISGFTDVYKHHLRVRQEALARGDYEEYMP